MALTRQPDKPQSGVPNRNGRIVTQQVPSNRYATSRFERLLLMMTVASVPMQWYLPKVGGFTIVFLLFGVMIGNKLLTKPALISKAMSHPVCLTGFLLVGIGLLMETVHASWEYYTVIRIGFMLVGAVAVGMYCRDNEALRAGIYGVLIGSVVMAVALILTTYGVLNAASADSFQEASRLRADTFADNPLGADLNMMGFLVGQGALTALAISLCTRKPFLSYAFLGLAIFNLIASFLPLSRGAVFITVVSGAVIIYVHGMLKPKIIITGFILLFAVLILVPEAVLSRLAFNTETHRDNRYRDGRTRILVATYEHLPEYILLGVGKRHFFGEWGQRSGFHKHDERVSGAHNCFVQITIFWGLPALLGLFALV